MYAIENTGSLFEKSFQNDHEGFVNATRELCAMTYDELSLKNFISGSNLPVIFLTEQCLMNHYILELFRKYGITDFDKVTIKSKVNGYSLNWALGYLINELNRDDFLPYEMPSRMLKLGIYLPLTIILSVIVVLTMIGLIYYEAKKRNQRYSFRNKEEVSKSDNKLLSIHN